MTSEPPRYDRDPAEEAERRRMHALERDKPQQPGPDRPDPIHVLRVRYRDAPGRDSYYLARWSLVARLRRDAEGSGDELEDLGKDAMQAARDAQYRDFAMGELFHVGTAEGSRWLLWTLPCPPEPVPARRQP